MKLIYKPKGAAGEYARYAVNFYNGCSNKCEYCYLKRGLGAGVLGGAVPRLKAGYNSIDEEIYDFFQDVRNHCRDLKKHGIFLSFTTDPMLKDTFGATLEATLGCMAYGIDVYILTKRTEYYDVLAERCKRMLSLKACGRLFLGTTLTGYDELEPFASSHESRIEMLRKAKRDGIGTFVSLEPVIDLTTATYIVRNISDCADEIRIGFKTPVKADNYPADDMREFFGIVSAICTERNIKVMWKDSFRKLAEKYGLSITF